MADTEETFGDRLKRFRTDAGLTQQQLAEAAGVNRFTVAKIEQNLHEPSWVTVQALAKALGTNCLAFEGTVEPPDEKPRGKVGRPRKGQVKEEPPARPEEPPAKKRKGKG